MTPYGLGESSALVCAGRPCQDVRHECHVVPAIGVQPQDISVVMISEAAPASPGDDYYAGGAFLFAHTVQAFNDAGATVASNALGLVHREK